MYSLTQYFKFLLEYFELAKFRVCHAIWTPIKKMSDISISLIFSHI